MSRTMRRGLGVFVVAAGLVIGACGGKEGGTASNSEAGGATASGHSAEVRGGAPAAVKLDENTIERYIATSEDMTALRTRIAEGKPPSQAEWEAAAKKHGFTYPEWLKLHKGVCAAVSVWRARKSYEMAEANVDKLKGTLSEDKLAKMRAGIPAVDMMGFTDADMALIEKYDKKIEASW